MKDLKILLYEYDNLTTNYRTKFFDYKKEIIKNIEHIFENELEYLYHIDTYIETGLRNITILATSKNMFEYVKEQSEFRILFKGTDEELTKVRNHGDITNTDKYKRTSFKINEITCLRFILAGSDFIDLDAFNKDIAILKNKMGE